MKELTWPGKTGKRLIVEDKYNWLTFDSDGDCAIWIVRPEAVVAGWCPEEFAWIWDEVTSFDEYIIPPEPGPWQEQIYWIGDD